MTDDVQCSKCSCTLTPGDAVRLWDGRDYCRECVEKACSGLAEYAAAHERLAEAPPPWSPRVVWAMRLLQWGPLVLAVLGGIVALAVQAPSLKPDGVGMIAMLALYGVVPALAIGLAKCNRQTVSAENGRIVVSRRIGGNRSAPLEQCRWHFADEHRQESRFLPRMGREPGIFVYVGRLKAPCAWTPRTLQLWTGFLNLAQVTYGRRKPKYR